VKRFGLIWIVLFLVFLIIYQVSAYMISGAFRFDSETLSHILIVPFFQAIIISAILASSLEPGTGRRILRDLLRIPLFLILITLDLVLLSAYWLAENQDWAYWGDVGTFGFFYLISKSLLTGGLALYLAIRIGPKMIFKSCLVMLGFALIWSSVELVIELNSAWLWIPGSLILFFAGFTALWILSQELLEARVWLSWFLVLFLPIGFFLLSPLMRQIPVNPTGKMAAMSLYLLGMSFLIAGIFQLITKLTRNTSSP
jgi:hypothetical protein